MSDEHTLKLIWRGAETQVDSSAAIDKGRQVEITLPANFHHALYVRLHPQEAATGVERLDETGGAELVHAMAGVAGLEDLDRLVAPLQRRGYRVRLADPAVLTLTPPAQPA